MRWCKDKRGVSWRITPRVLTEALAAGGNEAKRAFDAMMGMKKMTSPRSKPRGAADVHKRVLERFRAKWIPVRVKKTRQNKRLV